MFNNKNHLSILSQWIGRILGVFFGYLIAKGIGAFFGLLIGNFFDRYYAMNSNQYAVFYAIKNNVIRHCFLINLFAIMGYIAKLDGQVSETELTLARVMIKKLRLSNLEKSQVKQAFNQGKNKDFNYRSAVLQILNVAANNRNLLGLFILIQFDYAVQGGHLAKKIGLLNFICDTFKFLPIQNQAFFTKKDSESTYSATDYGQYTQPSSTNFLLQDAYTVLGLKTDATLKETKYAYRKMLSRHHPDKLIAKGASETDIKIAKQKTQTILHAYSEILKYKGWS